MSLDIYLSKDPAREEHLRELIYALYDKKQAAEERYDRQIDKIHSQLNSLQLFHANITHNLGIMAEKAGIYKALWRPEENGYTCARDIITVLEIGLKKLRDKPDYYKQFDSPNGWGLYVHFVPFVESVLDACRQNPDAHLIASR
jgi:hypothetical protein